MGFVDFSKHRTGTRAISGIASATSVWNTVLFESWGRVNLSGEACYPLIRRRTSSCSHRECNTTTSPTVPI